MLLNPYRFVAGSTLNSLILAQGPVNYWRNGEASGAAMVDEVAADGAYVGAVALGNPALYPGAGALTAAGGNFSGGMYGQSTAYPATMTAMTLLSIIRPTNLTGIHLAGVQRDDTGSSRKWQWRSNGTAIEFINLVTPTLVASSSGALAINTTYLLGFEVDTSGNYAMYVNGVSIKTGANPPANYGGAGDTYRIGFAIGPNANLDGRTCENAVFNKVLGPTVHAALFAATGL